MSPFLLGVSIFLALHVCPSSCSAAVPPVAVVRYCVLPDTEQDSVCPPPCSNGLCPCSNAPCHTLQYYADKSNFTSNAIFYFIEGEHTLNTVVNITDVDNLSLIGLGSDQDSTRVLCGPASAGFTVQYFTDFVVENLSFLHCRAELQVFPHGILLNNGSGLSINNVTVSHSSGYGLVALSVQGHLYINNSVFLHNQAVRGDSNGGNVVLIYSRCLKPSYLAIDRSRFLNGQGWYNESKSDWTTGGLTIEINCTNVSITISNSTLDSNVGGGLYVLFAMFTDNFVRVSNITISNGTGTGMTVTIDHHLPVNDPASCSPLLEVPHNLMELTEVLIVKNQGKVASLLIEDRLDSGILCTPQIVLIKNSEVADNIIKPNDSYPISLINTFESSNGNVFNTTHVVFQNVLFANHCGSVPFINLEVVSYVTFADCMFKNNENSVIRAVVTFLTFKGKNTFSNNSAFYGAGLQLLLDSILYLYQDSHILFVDNHVTRVGGAIYIDTFSHFNSGVCFYQVLTGGHSRNTTKIDFVNNTADYAGSSLYGGETLDCSFFSGKVRGRDEFKKIFNISNTESDPSAITADPRTVCMCMSGSQLPNCSSHHQNINAYPGEEFTLRLAVVGGRDGFNQDGIVPGAIHATFEPSQMPAHFSSLEDSQMLNNASCSNFTYSIFSTRKSVSFNLEVESYANQIPGIEITVHLEECPLGFSLSSNTSNCVCDPVFRRAGIHCYINNQSIFHPANTWIGFFNKSSDNGVVFHAHCPYGYCLAQSMYLVSSDPDRQCESHRTGLLCGKCEEHYSLTLGSQKCSKCSNLYLFVLLPMAASGLVLVAVLFLLNLTVTEGSINGLIFYANVVAMSRTVLNLDTSSSLYIFIAWLNLDLGIDTCLFDGMDAYTATWLQFAFPFYLWAIIITIVVVSNKFPRVTERFIGQNAVKVLATVLLLSYTKLQRTVITIFSTTSLTYPSGTVRYVWLYDANIEFLKGKHLPLFIAGIIILVVLIVPYTFGLALFQYFQACSTRRVFRWVNRLKPVFDSYAGPYKDKYRMWTGLLLVARTLLIVIFSLNFNSSPDFNYITILIVSLVLLAVNSRGIYKKWSHDMLESFFHLQLGLYAGVTIYATYNHGSVPAVADCSIAMVLVVFLTTVGYRVFSRVYCRKKVCCCCGGYEEEVEPLLDHVRAPAISPASSWRDIQRVQYS